MSEFIEKITTDVEALSEHIRSMVEYLENFYKVDTYIEISFIVGALVYSDANQTGKMAVFFTSEPFIIWKHKVDEILKGNLAWQVEARFAKEKQGEV